MSTEHSPAPTHPDAPAVSRRVEWNIASHAGAPVHRVRLRNRNGMEVSCLTFGGIIERIAVPDRHGTLANVVLGFDAVEDYFADRYYFGALIGRYANRIGGARFDLDGHSYRLDSNDGVNHLHGGAHGFHARVWSMALPDGDDCGSVQLTVQSPHGEGGYPGAVSLCVTYTLTPSDALIVDYEATSDRATPFSPTQHSYFNLAGPGRDVLGHQLTIPASHFTPVSEELIPTGELQPVDGTAFDFRAPRLIGSRIASTEQQMLRGDGYDHNFALDADSADGPRLAARLYEPTSGRRLEVFTTAPGMQLCTGNALHFGVSGKERTVYGHHAGVALETQHFPDAPNHPRFPSAILRPPARFHSRTIFQFSSDARDTEPLTPSQSP